MKTEHNKRRTFSTVIGGALAVSLASVLWGFDGIVLTPNLHDLDVGFVVFVLHLIPFALMQPFFYKKYRELVRHSWKETGSMFLVSLFGGALGTVCIVKSLFLVNFNHLSAIVLLQKLQPIFAIILAAIFLKERMKSSFALWATLAIVAGYFLTFGLNLPQVDASQNMLHAALFALLAAFSFGASTVFSKLSLNSFSFSSATFFRYGFATLIMLVYMLFTWKWTQFQSVTTLNWLIIALICTTTGGGAIFLYYYGLRKIKAMTSTILELFFPISAVVFDYFFNNTKLTPLQWTAAALMLFCVFMVNRKKH
ncbi:MAG: DMT family transporter [Bacteroidales bacterium]|nr:DMT family transporter [Bacteroidales bacterium]